MEVRGNKEKEDKRKKKLTPQQLKMRLIAVGSVIAILILIPVICYLVRDKQYRATTDAEASLSEILEIGDLSTVEYLYNSTVEVKNTEKYEVKYYVAYEGTVTMGVDFAKIKSEIVEEEGNKKVIQITLPPTEVQDVSVDIDSLDFIFPKEKYNTETVVQEAYGKCVKDLEVKAKLNKSLKESAREEAEDAIRAFLSPLKMDEKEYEIVFLEGEKE